MQAAVVRPPAPELDYHARVRKRDLDLAAERYKKFFRNRATEFIRGKGSLAVVSDPVCMGCTHCFDNCAFEAIDMVDRKFTLPELTYTSRKAVIIEENCVGCEKCAIVCPVDAIGMVPKDGWDVREGRLVQLGPPPATSRPFFQPPKPGEPRPPDEAEPFVAFREEAKASAKAPPKPVPAAMPVAAPVPSPPAPAEVQPQTPAPAASRPAAARRTLTPDEVRRLREEARKKALAAKGSEAKEGD